jgi:hypothetical protein
MTTTQPALTPLGRWYGFLAAIGSLAALQATIFPSWPKAASLPEAAVLKALRQAGLRPQPVKLSASKADGLRSQEVSVSAPLVFRLSGGEELRLVRGSFRQRYTLQTAGIAAKSPDLALKDRQLLAGPPPSTEGRIDNNPARQTCFVPHAPLPSAYGVTSEQILPLVDTATLGRAARIRRLIGSQANYNYSCILVSLRSPDQEAPVSETQWQRILAVLPSALAEANTGT